MKYIKPFIFITLFLVSFSTEAQDENWSDQQIELINIDCLHERGFTGKGITIAHLDDGCDSCDENEIFDYAREHKLWKASYDFVKDEELVFNNRGSHGTATVSIVHGKLEGKYTGIAYDANILMARTENVATETHQEEIDWREAVDWALLNNADIITSSLQYNEFDEGEGNFTYKDMDGKTTLITNAADYAASKGIIVVTLQGNFGSGPWYYLTAPGDADSVITVGAATAEGAKARFSGFGPSFDGRMKPDIMAMGQSTAVVNPNGSITRGNGTSYAAPAIAGLMACLKQAHPNRENVQFISAVRQSGSMYRNPSAEKGLGYGIADACKADDVLTEMDKSIDRKGKWIVYDDFRFKQRKNKIIIKSRNKENKITNLRLKDIFENELLKISYNKVVDIEHIDSGDYLIDVTFADQKMETIYLKK